MKTSTKYSPEVRERAVRMVHEHQGEHESQWAAISSIAAKVGCTAETMRRWVRQAEKDSGEREGLTASEQNIGSEEKMGSVPTIEHRSTTALRKF